MVMNNLVNNTDKNRFYLFEPAELPPFRALTALL